MRIDLERALADIATTAQGAATPVPIDRLLGRLHRRRAARQAVATVAGVGAVAAVAVGGAQLGRGTTPAEPTSLAPTANPVTSEYWAITPVECGAPAPTPTDASVYGVTLDASLDEDSIMPLGEGPAFTNLTGRFVLTNSSPAEFSLTAPEVPSVVITRDGEVAMSTSAPLVRAAERTIAVPPGGVQGFTWLYATGSCAIQADFSAGPVEPGDYQAYAVWRFIDEVTGARTELVSQPVTITVGPGVADPDAPEAAQAEAVLGQILSAGLSAQFPICGGAVYDHGDQPLALSLTLPRARYEAGETVTGDTFLRVTTEPVIADASVPYLVIAKDGVVVGQQLDDGGTAMVPADLSTGQSLPGSASGALVLCPTSDGDTLPLPGGTYDVYAVVEAFTYENRPAENPGNLDGAYSVVSEPVTVTVD